MGEQLHPSDVELISLYGEGSVINSVLSAYIKNNPGDIDILDEITELQLIKERQQPELPFEHCEELAAPCDQCAANK